MVGIWVKGGRGNRGVEITTKWGAYWSVLLAKYSGDQFEKNEVGWACSTYGGRGSYRILVGYLGEGGNLED